MSSPPPLEFGTIYHIYNRGTNGESIFVEARNYPHFLKLFAKHLEHVIDTYAYALLGNHFHFAVRVKTPEQIKAAFIAAEKPPPVKIGKRYASNKFSNFFNAYAKSFNKAYKRTGSLFEHPFHRVSITDGQQFKRTITYIHQNPQKHGFVADYRDWHWTSFATLVSDKPTRLKREVLLKWFGGKQAFLDAHDDMIDLDFGIDDDQI